MSFREKVIVYNAGVGPVAGKFKFYGLSESEGGKFSQGGSLVKEHNSDWYKSSDDTAINVEVINFAKYLAKKSQLFDRVIVKMDIEGEEVELLEDLIRSNEIKHIDTLYVEFHSEYQESRQSVLTKARENWILSAATKIPDLKIRIWH